MTRACRDCKHYFRIPPKLVVEGGQNHTIGGWCERPNAKAEDGKLYQAHIHPDCICNEWTPYREEKG